MRLGSEGSLDDAEARILDFPSERRIPNSNNETRHNGNEEETERGTNLQSYIFPSIRINDDDDNKKTFTHHKSNQSNPSCTT